MSEAQMESRQTELKSKRICRFCMSQTEPLSNIYSRENRLNSSAPLPLQIMACVSIEVFTNDGMPCTICDFCRMLMEHCYRFKQMCKKADTALRQYPLTGTWPNSLDLPKIPDELAQKQFPKLKSPPTSPTTSGITLVSAVPEKRTTTIQVEPPKLTKVYNNASGRPKLLNKNSIKILNKDAQVTTEPILSKPKIKRDNAGNVEIVTEIIDHNDLYEEPDPVKNAIPVETNVFPCPHCERSFPLRQLLDIHMVNHNRERSFECNICEKRFFSKYDLGKHMLIHTGEKPYECVVCKKAFTRSTLLHRHEKVHTDQPKFLCVYCEKPFLSKDELEKHTERHQKNRPFSCKICGKCFAFKQGLERHETVHAKNQPFPCQYCDQSFSTPSKLSRHLTAHAGDRPFPCKLCPKSYLLSHHLTRHLRSHSQGSGSYKCYDCERTFTTRDDLIYHSAVHATQNLVCPLCKEHFEDLDLVTEHIKQHAEGEQYACEFCDLIFLTADKLQSHGDAEHPEDLAAYEEHTKNNIIDIKREINMQYDSSQDGQNEEGEVIQEFIIEEYHQEDESIIEERTSRSTSVKREVSVGNEMNAKIKKPVSSNSTRRSFGSITESKSTTPSRVQESKSRPAEIEQADEEIDYEEMEIETLERDDEEEINFEVEEDVEEEIVEPPPKMLRVGRKSGPATRTVLNTRASVVIKEEIKTETPKSKTPLIKIEASNSVTSKQTTINTVLQQLPKTVTIVKKEKQSPGEKPKIESTRETRASAANNEKNQKKPEIRILNERVVKKSINREVTVKTTPPKQVDTKQSPKIHNEKSLENNTTKGKITESNTPTGSSAKSPSSAATTSATDKRPNPKQLSASISGSKKLVEMMIGDKKVKVQKIMMTKAEVAAMAKEGKIEMKGGTMILKHDNKITAKLVTKKIGGTGK